MAYLHEIPMLQAYKRLYMLGNKPYRQKKVSFDEFGQGAASAMRAQDMKLAADKMRAAAANRQERSDIDFIKGRDPASPVKDERYATSMGTFVPGTGGDPFAIAAEHQKNNNEAEQTRIGGVYTPKGLETAHKNAMLNSEDIMRQRAMIGQGMQLSVPDVEELDTYSPFFQGN